jgi:hypothetical protein
MSMKVVFASFMLARVDKKGRKLGMGIFFGDNLSDISRDILIQYTHHNRPENKSRRLSYEIILYSTSKNIFFVC